MFIYRPHMPPPENKIVWCDCDREVQIHQKLTNYVNSAKTINISSCSGWIKWLVFIPLLEIIGVVGLGDKNLCTTPLGLQNGQFPNEGLTSSSFYVSSVGPHQARLNVESNGGAWCPKEPIGAGVREWLQVAFNETYFISAVQLQGRFAKGRGQEYAEYFEIEYTRPGFSEVHEWRKYYRYDGKSVLPGNSDTTTISTVNLRPPLIAQKLRILPYSSHRRTVCLRLELLGCPFNDGILSYRMRQGDLYSEGISLLDESYDGTGSKLDRKVNLGGVKAAIDNFSNNNDVLPNQQQEEFANNESEPANSNFSVHHLFQLKTTPSSGGGDVKSMLSAGLGQLCDKIEGLSSFSMDLGYGIGNGWVGWKKSTKDEEFVEILVEFERVRKFSRLDIFTNNHPSKGVELFAKVNLYFSIGGEQFSRRSGVQLSSSLGGLGKEEARNVSIQLAATEGDSNNSNATVGKWVKIHLFFRATWIVIGELYFHSEIFDGNVTDEELSGIGGVDVQMDFPDTQSSLEIRDMSSPLVETVIGIVCGVLLLAFVAAGVVYWIRQNNKSSLSTSPCPKFLTAGRGSLFWRPSSWRSRSVPTHIVNNHEGSSGNGGPELKGMLLTMSTLNGDLPTSALIMGNDHHHPLCPPPKYSEISKGTTMGTMHQHQENTSFVEEKYRSTLLNRPTKRKNPQELSPRNSKGNPRFHTTRGGGGEHHRRYEKPEPLTMTLRSNQLASALEGLASSSCDSNNVAEDDSDDSSEARSRSRKKKRSARCWNIVTEEGRAYGNQTTLSVPKISLSQLQLVENLGSCSFGKVHLYEYYGDQPPIRTIAKTLKSISEIHFLSTLDHEHVAELIGICTDSKSSLLLALYPAPECGDLCSFLSRLSTAPSLSWLLNVGCQIAAGMNYLESLSLVHRDLAARNCLVEREGTIRISDLAMACKQFREDYFFDPISGQLIPLRWWSWEAIVMDEFSMKSSVWSFGVTLWEVLTLGRQKPHSHISDDQLTLVAQTYGSTSSNKKEEEAALWLPQPVLGPPEIFQLMCDCWQPSPSRRPTFQNIHLFLQQKCKSFHPAKF